MNTANDSEVPLWGVVFAFSIGLGLLWLFLRNFLRARRARRWPTAPGRILQSEFLVDDGYTLKMTYEYTVDGVQRLGQRFRFASNHYDWERSINAILARYPVGAPVRVLYNPANPSVCVLEAHFEWGSWWPVLVFALAILVPWTYFTVLPRARRPADVFAKGSLGAPAAIAAPLRDQLGRHDLESIVILPDRVTVCVRDRANPQRHELYDFSSGSFGNARPSPSCTPQFPSMAQANDPMVAVATPPPSSDTFHADDVDFALLPTIVADARRRTGVQRPTLTKLAIRRSTYQAIRETLVEVFISGERGSDHLHYDLQGTFIDNPGQYNRIGVGPRPWAHRRDAGPAAP